MYVHTCMHACMYAHFFVYVCVCENMITIRLRVMGLHGYVFRVIMKFNESL